MKYKITKIWSILLLFPIVYIGVIGILTWIDVYVYNEWDQKYGQEGSFWIALKIWLLLLFFVLPGYIGIVVAQWKLIRDLSFKQLTISTISSGILSSLCMKLIPVGESEFGLRSLMNLILGPAIWTFICLSIANKDEYIRKAKKNVT